ncbi:MAG: shikimate kinase, partial [Longimicrobiales bacterium]
MNRILIFGNSGSGKSTMARQVAREHHLPHLDLDQLAWSDAGVRKPFRESATEIQSFMEQNPEWVIEGCYADLLDLARMHATELRFLNPGTETCIANC